LWRRDDKVLGPPKSLFLASSGIALGR
jgi:hypothetical protein